MRRTSSCFEQRPAQECHSLSVSNVRESPTAVTSKPNLDNAPNRSAGQLVSSGTRPGDRILSALGNDSSRTVDLDRELRIGCRKGVGGIYVGPQSISNSKETGAGGEGHLFPRLRPTQKQPSVLSRPAAKPGAAKLPGLKAWLRVASSRGLARYFCYV
jgi:hypothetical protein